MPTRDCSAVVRVMCYTTVSGSFVDSVFYMSARVRYSVVNHFVAPSVRIELTVTSLRKPAARAFNQRREYVLRFSMRRKLVCLSLRYTCVSWFSLFFAFFFNGILQILFD